MNTLEEILAALKHNKLRTTMTGLSVSWGIFILIVLLGAGNGLQNGVTSNFGNRATNTVQMWPGQTSLPYKGLKSSRDLDFTEKELNTVNDNVPESDEETGIIDKNSTITVGSEYGSYRIKGVHPSYQKIYNLEFEPGKGRFINNLDIEKSNKIIVLDKKIEETLFKGKSALGQYVQLGPIMFKVVGINSKKESWDGTQAYIPFSTAQSIYNPDKKFNSIAFTTQGLDSKETN